MGIRELDKNACVKLTKIQEVHWWGYLLASENVYKKSAAAKFMITKSVDLKDDECFRRIYTSQARVAFELP